MNIPNVNRKMDEPPTMEELECLISWPKETNGYYNERKAIQEFIELCKKIGFGRMAQLAQQIEDIWRTPEKVTEYLKIKEERFKSLNWDI